MRRVLLVPSSSPTLSPIYDALDVSLTSIITWFLLNHDMVSRRIYKLSFYGGHSITKAKNGALFCRGCVSSERRKSRVLQWAIGLGLAVVPETFVELRKSAISLECRLCSYDSVRHLPSLGLELVQRRGALYFFARSQVSFRWWMTRDRQVCGAPEMSHQPLPYVSTRQGVVLLAADKKTSNLFFSFLFFCFCFSPPFVVVVGVVVVVMRDGSMV